MYRLVNISDINRLTDYDRNLLTQSLDEVGVHLDDENKVRFEMDLDKMSSLKISELRDILETATDYAAEMTRLAKVDFRAKDSRRNTSTEVVDSAEQTFRRNFILTNLLLQAFEKVDAVQTAHWKALRKAAGV